MRSKHGWVSALEERAAIEAALRGALVGRGLVAVRYVELVYEKPAWATGRFHSIDYGVEFELADGATWAIMWQQEGWIEEACKAAAVRLLACCCPMATLEPRGWTKAGVCGDCRRA